MSERQCAHVCVGGREREREISFFSPPSPQFVIDSPNFLTPAPATSPLLLSSLLLFSLLLPRSSYTSTHATPHLINSTLSQQAAGYGIVYFAKKMLADKGISLEGKRCLITGSDSVSTQHVHLLHVLIGMCVLFC